MDFKYSVPVMIKQLEKQKEELAEKLSREKEEAEQRKFEGWVLKIELIIPDIFSGNRVTIESFNKWREAFEKEFFAAELEAKKVCLLF